MCVPQCFKQQMFQLAKLVIFHDMTTINIMKNSDNSSSFGSFSAKMSQSGIKQGRKCTFCLCL